MKGFFRRCFFFGLALLSGHLPAKATIKLPTVRLGNEYGGWEFYPKTLNKKSIVYSLGVGEDISFDRALVKKFGCRVHLYDPTPRSITFIKQQKLSSKFIFHPLAISAARGKIKFYSPSNPAYVSHSMTNKGKEFITVESDTLQHQMKLNKHSNIDLLKMDIEGAEYQVLEEVLQNNLTIKQILVEFHPSSYATQAKKVISKLRKQDYDIYAVSDSFRELSFIKI
jgi:FkbM family methyltransferase